MFLDRHLRFNGAYWEQCRPQSGHPVWSSWQPVPWHLQSDISQYIELVRSEFPGCIVLFEDLL